MRPRFSCLFVFVEAEQTSISLQMPFMSLIYALLAKEQSEIPFKLQLFISTELSQSSA